MSENREVSVRNNSEEVSQQLYRRQLALGQNSGEVNTSPLNRDYDAQFGYPSVISKHDYQHMYDRDPVAHRVVELYPVECWQQLPSILDSDAPLSLTLRCRLSRCFPFTIFGGCCVVLIYLAALVTMVLSLWVLGTDAP